ncbi:peptidase U34, partial [Nocardioides pelophilus]|uniref:peptidase U34 n=1 Tax=Nocardioides pelophilus TaxID=2172019 RepID=UPI001601C276
MCDTMVGITDEGVLFAKNSDRDPSEAQVLRWLPAAEHPAGTRLQCTWAEIDQAPRTHAVLLSQPWWMWGAEIGANEHGVVIGNEAVFTRRTGDRGDGALLGMDLLRLALERATDATAAVATIVDLLEEHGQGGACSHEHPRFTYDNSFIVADPDRAIVLETAGRRWATEEVRGPGRSISNGLTIPAFARMHADPVRGRVAACAVRRERTEAAASSASAPADLFRALRDHGPGSGPQWSLVNGALSAPCAHAGGLVTSTQSTASWVADLRAAPVHWVTATSAPCTSLFKPVRVEVPLQVDPEPMPSNVSDPAYLWWRHERLHRRVLRDHPASLARFVDERDRLERSWLAEPPRDAFADADAAEARWLSDLVAADLPDRRPAWLRRQWRATGPAA